jgi:6-phosphogluconate dehydrogenase (decarboxylating)
MQIGLIGHGRTGANIADFANPMMSAMRQEFGGHVERPAGESKAEA